MAPAMDSSLPLVSNVPPPASSRIDRLGLSETVPSALSVPPFKVRPPLGSPRAPSVAMASAPALTVHDVTAAVELMSVQTLAPVFSKTPNPWYCAPPPIWPASTVASVAPPSRRVSAVLAATTLPMMAEPARSSRTLVPLPNVMALAMAESSPRLRR